MARLTPITSKDQVPAQYHDIADKVIASRGGIRGPFTMLMHCPPIAQHYVSIGGYVRFEGKLDHRVRVLAAMVAARAARLRTPHVERLELARRLGVPESTITAIRENHSRDVPAEDLQIIEFSRALLRKHRVDEATFQALIKRFGNEQFIELTATIGYYTMLTMTVNACEVEPAPDYEVLKT